MPRAVDRLDEDKSHHVLIPACKQPPFNYDMPWTMCAANRFSTSSDWSPGLRRDLSSQRITKRLPDQQSFVASVTSQLASFRRSVLKRATGISARPDWERGQNRWYSRRAHGPDKGRSPDRCLRCRPYEGCCRSSPPAMPSAVWVVFS